MRRWNLRRGFGQATQVAAERVQLTDEIGAIATSSEDLAGMARELEELVGKFTL